MDECKYDISDCDVNANCTNTYGSYNCTCKVGYTGDGHSCSGSFEDGLADKCFSIFVFFGVSSHNLIQQYPCKFSYSYHDLHLACFKAVVLIDLVKKFC